ncbi:MAG: ribbon-helix-helix domain-containing protein [Cyanobacteria bacterium P01_F01_bin.143]
MNFNIYIEDPLGNRLEESVKKSGKSRNEIIQEAIQLWLERQQKSQWPQSILDWQGVSDAIKFESYREELLPPGESDIF